MGCLLAAAAPTIVNLKGDRFIPRILEPIREKSTIIETDSTLKSFMLVQSGKADVALGRKVYRNPVNKFVAGFIGSPAMNFVDYIF